MEALQKIAIRIFRAVTVVFAVAVFACVLFGCGDDRVGIKLLRSEISLYVGESRSILPYIALEPATSDSSVLKLSTDSDGLKIDGMTVTAVKPCSAKVKISGYEKSVELSVTVSYRDVNSVTVSAENAVQTVASGKPKKVILTAEFDKSEHPNSVAKWKVNGETLDGNSVEFTPPDFGEYSVTAEVDGVTASSVIRVYRKTDVTVIHDFDNILDGYHVYGKTDVTDNQNKALASLFDPLTFTAYEKVNTLNPKSVYEWTVNGEVKSTSPVLNFTPVKSGEYSVSLTVNGDAKKIDGKDCFTFIALQGLAPAASVEYDDMGGVYVRWAAGLDVLWVSVTDGNGKRVVFDITDAASSHLFVKNSFRATEYIDVCAASPKRYEIALGTMDGRYDIVFDQLNERARQYLDNTVLCKNSFVTDESSARAWVKELYATNKISAECYVLGGAQSVVGAVQNQANALGLEATVTAEGDVLSVTFLPYENAPTNSVSVTINTLYATIPHIEYSADNRRPNEYIFTSDRSQKTVAVSGTEQLLAVLQSGYKPTAEKGDIASTVYSAAKRVLLNIIGADYTPRQKVHAIYDWLQYVTVNIESADRQSYAGFLEGVFAARRQSGSGYAVTSAGAAKAFALLCGIEGIPCDISCDSRSERFYNKVKLDGSWYNVDVYGGKVTGEALSQSVVTEYTSHRGLLISDSELITLGCVVSDGINAFDTTDSEYLQKHTYNKVYFDNFVDLAEADDYQTVRAAVFYAFDNVKRGNTRIPYIGSELIIYNNTFGVEFAFSEDFTNEQISTLITNINIAITEYSKSVTDVEFISNTRRTITIDNIIIAVAVATSAGA